MFNRKGDTEWADNYYTLEELRLIVEDESEKMSDKEKYVRMRDCEPTFLQHVLTWASNNIKDSQKEEIFVNEITGDYKII